MTLSQIVAFNARYVRASGVIVECDAARGTVAIETAHGETIAFLQDSEGEAFIDEAQSVYEQVGTIGIDEAWQHLAMQYVDNCDSV